MQNYKNSMNEATNMDKHLMNAVQGGGVASDISNMHVENQFSLNKDQVNKSDNGKAN